VLIAALLTPNLRRFAEAHGLLDEPKDSRRVHRRAVPRVGGLAVVAAFYTPLVGMLVYEPDLGQYFLSKGWSSFSFLLGGLVIAALGLYDDLRGANALQKFAVQFGVAALLYPFGFAIEEIVLPGGALQLGIFAFPVTALWIVGIINAINLIDGLDGLAGGVALCAVLTNLVVASTQPHQIMTLCMATLAGALLGFLIYNFNPASIFLGDTGSLFLGYVLAASSIRTHHKSTTMISVSLLVPMVALALPITDTLLAMGRRFLAGRPMFSGDREHIHHRLLRLGLSHRQVVLVLYAASFVFGGAALIVALAEDRIVGWSIVALLGATFLALHGLGYFHGAKETLRVRRRNLALRSAVADIAYSMKRAGSVHEVLESAKLFASAVAADRMRVNLELKQFEVSLAGVASNDPVAGAFLAQFNLPDSLGNVELEWRDGRAQVDRDDEIAAKRLCDHIAHALRRVSPDLRRRSPSPALAPAEVLFAPFLSRGTRPRRGTGS
jgi:UDP-GlcNAc:undecaprenyl-phosphate GlcNAc-1-phosphate transferase